MRNVDNQLVSIIVPVFNAEPYLAQCLDSILAQTHRELEVICLNDGSTDGSLAIMQAYAARDERIRVIDKQNQGYGATCNRGLEEARGAWISIVEPDDLLQPGVRLVNRECGCGSRILLDEQLARRGVSGAAIEGYEREANSALSMASFVARGAADVGIGAERVFHQVEGVGFLPLQDEWLDIVLAKRPGCERTVDAIAKLARTRPFREEIGSIVGYDASRMGEVVFER